LTFTTVADGDLSKKSFHLSCGLCNQQTRLQSYARRPAAASANFATLGGCSRCDWSLVVAHIAARVRPNPQKISYCDSGSTRNAKRHHPRNHYCYQEALTL